MSQKKNHPQAPEDHLSTRLKLGLPAHFCTMSIAEHATRELTGNPVKPTNLPRGTHPFDTKQGPKKS